VQQEDRRSAVISRRRKFQRMGQPGWRRHAEARGMHESEQLKQVEPR